MNLGYLFALGAFGLWGFTPIYFKTLGHIAPTDIVANRVLWSSLLLTLIISVIAKWEKVVVVIKQPNQLVILLFTTLLIATNWLVFIWAINNDRMLDTSLGYYINPLITLFLGYVFLKERHSPLAWLAIVLAASGVIFQLISLGYLPWISLVLAFSFGFYGLLHKRTSTDSLTSLFIETCLILPFALLYMVWLNSQGEIPAISNSDNWLLLALAGPITTAPLLFFSAAAKRLPLAQIGFFQYLSPSILFLLAVFVYQENYENEKLITFAFIWLALLLFTWDSRRRA
ncbi:EamA family transporter RarD [Marinomonas epiphytica]